VIPKEMLQHRGPAKVFNGQEEALKALQQNRVQPGDVVVVRYEGPRGGPGLTEVFTVIGYMNAAGLETKCALVTDGKISGFAKGPFICQVSPEAAEGGPMALVRDGDVIEYDIPTRRVDLVVPADELARRRASWQPRKRELKGILARYAKLAQSASKGAVLRDTIGG
jgi:dihydroxy-acid dehydratase